MGEPLMKRPLADRAAGRRWPPPSELRASRPRRDQPRRPHPLQVGLAVRPGRQVESRWGDSGEAERAPPLAKTSMHARSPSIAACPPRRIRATATASRSKLHCDAHLPKVDKRPPRRSLARILKSRQRRSQKQERQEQVRQSHQAAHRPAAYSSPGRR